MFTGPLEQARAGDGRRLLPQGVLLRLDGDSTGGGGPGGVERVPAVASAGLARAEFGGCVQGVQGGRWKVEGAVGGLSAREAADAADGGGEGFERWENAAGGARTLFDGVDCAVVAHCAVAGLDADAGSEVDAGAGGAEK